MKDTAGVGVELMKIYSFERRSHHPNDAPRPIKPNPNYKAERPDPLSLSEEHVEGEWSSTNIGGDRAEKGRIPDRLSGA
jgi:hypothetical protein